MSETYDIKTQCDNCTRYFESHVPKGTTIKDFGKEFEFVKCTICECETRLNTGSIL